MFLVENLPIKAMDSGNARKARSPKIKQATRKMNITFEDLPPLKTSKPVNCSLTT